MVPLGDSELVVSRRSALARAFVRGLQLTCASAALVLSGCSGDAGSAEARAIEPHVYARTAVFGASASAGFGLNTEAGREVVLADVLEVAAPGTFTEILDASALVFFMAPERRLDEALAKIEEFGPELVIGVDILFWFAYGPRPDEERVDYLERGIARLETFLASNPVTLLVGDFPDVRDAHWLVMPQSFKPDDASLAALQTRIAEWCESRSDVELVPLAAFVDAMLTGRSVEFFGRTIDTTDRARFMQSDDLHPTLEGTAALALMVLQTLERITPLGDAIRSDTASVAQMVREGS